jgi:hypothetical protein
MKLSRNIILDFHSLLNRAFDRTITEEEAAHLNRLIAEHPSLEKHYFDFINLQMAFRELKLITEAETTETLPRIDLMLRQLSQWENAAPALKIQSDSDHKTIDRPDQAPSRHKVNRFLFSVAITSMAAFFLLAAYAWLNPRTVAERVATLTDSIDAQWALPPQNGNIFYDKSMEYFLQRGIAKVTLDNGVIVTIEGPAHFAFTTYDKMQLRSGRLFADVPINARGFIVETPSSRIIDLGTEFGVKIDSDGATSVHLFKGKASVRPGAKGHTGNAEILIAGQAKRMDTAGHSQDIPLARTAFVRNINSACRLVWRGQNKIDLANISLAATALMPRREISGLTLFRVLWPAIVRKTETHQTTSSRFIIIHLLTVYSFPTARQANCHVTRRCLRGLSSYIRYFYTEICASPYTVVRSLLEYQNSHGHSCILIHANAGITYDLDAFRADFPGLEIVRFETLLRISEASPRQPQGDFWILVDGKPRYSKINVTQKGDIEFVRIRAVEDRPFLDAGGDRGRTTDRTAQYRQRLVCLC